MNDKTGKGAAPARAPLAVAVAVVMAAAFAANGHAEAAHGAFARFEPAHMPAGGVVYEVTSCADDGSPGTLRDVIAHAGSGDTADLSTLTCSTITLANGEIVIAQDDFAITSNSPVTIDAGRTSRVIEHDGGGLLELRGVAATNGYAKYNTEIGFAKGGCILSNGNVYLDTSSVTSCSVANEFGQGRGGGVYTLGKLGIYDYSSISSNVASGRDAFGGGAFAANGAYASFATISGNTATTVTGATGSTVEGGGIYSATRVRIRATTVSGNQAIAADGIVRGGGASAHSNLYLAFSTVTGNNASSPGSSGGGIASSGYTNYVYSTTIDHNQSANNSALAFSGTGGNVQIENSTISTNAATSGSSALFSSQATSIVNSTIAFNTATGTDAGLYFYAGAPLDIESTIVADNTSSSGTSIDFVSHDVVTGDHNLIENAGSTVPADTLVGVAPELGPLALNGSVGVMTHALAPTSPAIDRGSNSRDLEFDERYAPHPRVFGTSADIGAYEWSGDDPGDTIFANGFD